MSYKKITSIEELKNIAKDEYIDCFIELNYGIRSSKVISYLSDSNTFYIEHCIDDTIEFMTEKKLLKSNIGEAITKGSFWQDK